MSATLIEGSTPQDLVTARFTDGSAGTYNTVEEALDQASYDEELGYRTLKDVIKGAWDDHQAVENPDVVAGPNELAQHREEWAKKWGQVAGILMPREEADRQLAAATSPTPEPSSSVRS